MKITLIILAAVLAVFILYFLVNIFSPKQNKLNEKLRLNTKKHATLYLVFSLMLTPVVGYSIQYQDKQATAQSYGFKAYDAYELEAKRAKSYNLTIENYQAAMKAALADGFTNYTEHQQYLEAKQNGYSNYNNYNRDVQLAKSYGFSLDVYRNAKAESDAKNFEYFDDYLLHIEKESLAKKLQNVSKLEGDYNIDSVPLGVKKNELLSLIDDCKISQIPDYSFPVTNSLAPRNGAQVSHFFPATSTNSNFGLTAYSMNFSIMPGLDRQAITKYEMKCETNRYDLWFLNSDNSLVMYEKTIHMPAIRQYEQTVNRIENILTAKCDSEINVGLEMDFQEHGDRKVKNLYCKSFQDYIIATIIDGAVIAGVRQDPDIHIGYLNDRLWKKYINNLHAVKGKKRDVTFTKNTNRNKTKTIESRI